MMWDFMPLTLTRGDEEWVCHIAVHSTSRCLVILTYSERDWTQTFAAAVLLVSNLART